MEDTRWSILFDELSKSAEQVEKDGPYIIFADFHTPHRADANVVEIHAFVGDFDGSMTLEEIVEHRQGLSFAVYSTHSHSVEEPRYRLVIPYRQGVTPSQQKLVFAHFQKVFEGKMDRSCTNPSRLWFMPAHRPGAQPDFFEGFGEVFDPTDLLAGAKEDNSREDYPLVAPFPALPSIDITKAVMEGSRNATLTRLVGRWFGQNNDLDTVSLLAHGWNHKCAKPPLPEHEVESTVRSILKRHMQNHPDYSPVSKDLANTPAFAADEFDIGAMLDTKAPARDWTVSHLVPKGEVGLLAAPGGTGKSFAALHIAIAVATGTDFHGLATTQGTVVIFAAEDDRDEIHRRLEAVLTDSQVNRDLLRRNLKIKSTVGLDMLLTKQDGREVLVTALVDRLAMSIEAFENVQLVIIDPVSRFRGGDSENEATQATRFVQAMEQLSKKTGAAVLGVCHTAKSAAKSGEVSQHVVRGSAGLVDGVRYVLQLYPACEKEATKACLPSGKYLRLDLVKGNYSAGLTKPLWLRVGHGGRHDPVDLAAAVFCEVTEDADQDEVTPERGGTAAEAVAKFVLAQVAAGQEWSVRSLTRAHSSVGLGLGLRELERAVNEALALGYLAKTSECGYLTAGRTQLPTAAQR